MKPIKITFNDVKQLIPTYIPTVDDDRIFLIVYNGVVEAAVHRNGQVFKGIVSGETLIPDGWVEFVEESK